MGFDDWWADYEKRTDQSERIADLLVELFPLLGLDQAKNFLSVGPASAMIEDILMQESLRNITNAYAIEPCPVFLKNFEKMMESYDVKSENYNGFLQDYEGTPEKVDLILVTHCAYYFHKTFRHDVGRLMDMLTDDGALVFATKDDNEFNKCLVDLLPESDHVHGFDQLPSVDKFRDDLHSVAADVQEFDTAHTLDIENTTWGDQSYVSLLINRPVTKMEIHDMCKSMKSLCSPGSTKLLLKDKVFIVRK